jgi:hypothetical protein
LFHEKPSTWAGFARMAFYDRGLGIRENRAYFGTHEKPRDVIQPRWGVYRLGGRRAERMLFTVTAPNSDAAIERAIKENEIPERERWRISVQREA